MKPAGVASLLMASTAATSLASGTSGSATTSKSAPCGLARKACTTSSSSSRSTEQVA